MTAKIKRFIAAFIISAFGAAAFADLPAELIKKQVEGINAELENNNIDEAYAKSTALLKTFNNTAFFPASVTFITAQSYDKYLDKIEAEKLYSRISDIEANLSVFTGISNAKFQIKLLRLKNLEISEKQEKLVAAEKKEGLDKKAPTEASVKELQRQSENTAKALERIAEISENFIQTTDKIAEGAEQNQKENLKFLGKYAAFIFAGIVILILLIFIVLIIAVVATKKSDSDSKKVGEALRALAGMQQQNNQLLLGSIVEMNNLAGLNYKGNSGWGVNALPSPEMSDYEKEELKKLAYECERLGSEIDQLSNRKNNSKNVSELVFKLAVKLGLNQNSAMLYFCAAMVCDAGFKSLPPELLNGENLSEEQKNQLRLHVSSQFNDFLDFVPEQWWKIFEDAAKYHHENYDGSGYPEGLKGNEIPQIARLIRVAESYNSLISIRNYRQIQDKESAIKELLSESEIYDSEVVKALDTIV